MSRPVDPLFGAAPRPRPDGILSVPGTVPPPAPGPGDDAGSRPIVPPPRRLSRHPAATGPVVLVGLMGAGKTTVGRRVAALLGIPFRDADAEIERAAGLSVSEIFGRYGETEFRRGEQGVIRRLLAGPPIVLATGGGAFVDAGTRAAVRAAARSVWLRCPLPVLVRRTAGRTHRPLLNNGDPAAVLGALMASRAPFYAEADIVVDCGDETVEHTALTVVDALSRHQAPCSVPVSLDRHSYDVTVGTGLLRRAGAILAPVLPRRQAVVVTDATVAALHLPALIEGLDQAGIESRTVVVPPGEASKSLAGLGALVDRILDGGSVGAPAGVSPDPAPGTASPERPWSGLERRTAVIALGGGVVGDLAGFAAATIMRGLPFVQVPTTLLAQVDSSVGGKTGINVPAGKNLLGAFHQPVAVLADTDTLSTLPRRELRAGLAEIVKAGLIADPDLFAWCENHGADLVDGDPGLMADAVRRACAFKAAVVAGDEREERASGGRALLNLGHTFGHAVEAEFGFDGTVLHGEAVAIGLVLAFRLSVAIGLCPSGDAVRVESVLRAVGLPADLRALPRRVAADALMARMRGDKKRRDGRIGFVLARGIGAAFTTDAVEPEALRRTLVEAGAART